MSKRISTVLATVLSLAAAVPAVANQSEIDVWEAFLKPKHFPDVELRDSKAVFELKTPYRAEDAALTPISINARIPQTEERYIEKLWIFVDKNPQPHVGTFHLTPAMGRADLAMRVRIDQYTNIRAIAALNTGEHYLATNFVKAQGGCSAPLGSDLEAAMQRLGKMKFRARELEQEQGLVLAQFHVSHPNITGMQMDQRTRLIRPEHYVKEVRLEYNGELIMRAETGFSVSEDPSFRFFFKPGEAGKLRAEVKDSEGNHFTEEFEVGI